MNELPLSTPSTVEVKKDDEITDVPCRSVVFKCAGRSYCLLLYGKLSEELVNQVVVLELEFGSKLEGRILWDEKNFASGQWTALQADPCGWFATRLKLVHRKIYGYPMKTRDGNFP